MSKYFIIRIRHCYSNSHKISAYPKDLTTNMSKSYTSSFNRAKSVRQRVRTRAYCLEINILLVVITWSNHTCNKHIEWKSKTWVINSPINPFISDRKLLNLNFSFRQPMLTTWFFSQFQCTSGTLFYIFNPNF